MSSRALPVPDVWCYRPYSIRRGVAAQLDLTEGFTNLPSNFWRRGIIGASCMYKIITILLISLVGRRAPAADLTVRPALAFSLTFGGNNADTGAAVAVDVSGNVYVTGTTTSTDFPVKNGFQ